MEITATKTLTLSLYISEEEFDEMARQVKEDGYTIHEAYENLCEGIEPEYDPEGYFASRYLYKEIKEKILERL